MLKKVYFIACFIFLFFTHTSCDKEDFKPIHKIIPQHLLEEISKHVPLYEGSHPPTIEGDYILSPCQLLYSSFPYQSTDSLPDYSFSLSNQTKKENTNFIVFAGDNQLLRIDNCDKVYLNGSENNFTAYYSIKGTHYTGVSYKAALVLSGTKTSEGINNFYLTLILLNKSTKNSDTELMPKNSFRIISSSDKIARYKSNDTTQKNILITNMLLEKSL